MKNANFGEHNKANISAQTNNIRLHKRDGAKVVYVTDSFMSTCSISATLEARLNGSGKKHTKLAGNRHSHRSVAVSVETKVKKRLSTQRITSASVSIFTTLLLTTICADPCITERHCDEAQPIRASA